MSKPAFLFPGQGAQAVGMGRQWAESVPAARALYDRAKDLLGYDLAQLCFDGPTQKLDSTVYSQPALFVTSLAALETLKATQADVVASCQAAAGLSLGEYTALVFAEVMTFDDGLRVVQQRGQAMQDAADAAQGGMLSILGLPLDQIQKLCDEARGSDVLQVANLLCPGNIVVSGGKAACERVAKLADQAGAMKTIPLAVAGAFHTPLMQSAVSRLSDALAGVQLRPPRIPVVSNVDAEVHSDPEEIRQLLIQQVVSPVRWEDSQRLLIAQGYGPFYEVGPGRVLRSLLKRIDRKAEAAGTE